MKVEYVDHSGSDLLVVNAARASFGKHSNDLNDKDVRLINYLAKHKHVLPFRHPHLTLQCKAPLFVARQLMKHQVGFSWSEESRRYVKTSPEFYWPDKWRKAADNVKQGSSDEEVALVTHYEYTTLPEGNKVTSQVAPRNLAEGAVQWSVLCYNELLAGGVAPEQARMVLPQNMYTTWMWTGSLLAWVQMLKQRLDSHTQKETRDFAQMVDKIVAELYPVSYKALMENV